MKRTLLLIALFLFAESARASQTQLFAQTEPTLSGGSIPQGAQRVPMLTVTLKASCENDVPVTSLKIHHKGKGDSSDLLRIYAMEGTKRLSRAATFSDDQEAVLRFRHWVIKACTEKTITILADISATAAAGSEHTLHVVSPDDIEAGDATVSISAMQAKTPSRLAPSSAGVISVTYPPVHSTVTFGLSRTIGRIRLSADKQEDHLIQAITLTNDGKARDADLQNIRLESANRSIVSSVAPSMEGDRVRLSFDPPLQLQRNEEKVLLIKANVQASRRQTIRLLIEEPGDIEASSTSKR